MKAKEDSMIAQLHDPRLRLCENPCAKVVHHGLDFSRSVYRATGTWPAGLANLAKGSVRLSAPKTIAANCVKITATNVGTNFQPTMADSSDAMPLCFSESQWRSMTRSASTAERPVGTIMKYHLAANGVHWTPRRTLISTNKQARYERTFCVTSYVALAGQGGRRYTMDVHIVCSGLHGST